MSGNKDCKFCDKRGLLWLPLRYSAVGADTLAALSSLPKLSGKLGRGVVDLPLTRTKYAVRMLRSGYLYVLLDRQGIKYWNAYRVTDDAFLYKFNPEEPPLIEPEFTCQRDTCGINASMVAIPEANDVSRVWSLFVPTPLTKGTLDDYKANADKYAGEGKLQTFSPSQWLSGGTEQPHSLLAPELLTKVAEFILFTQPVNPFGTALGQALQQQLFPANKDAYSGGVPPDDKGNYIGRLGHLYNTIKRLGHASFALHDHIGITQELNNFRNAALWPVEAFLSKKEGEVDNQRRLEVMQAIDDVHNGIKTHFIGLGKQRIQLVEQANLPDLRANTVHQLRGLGRVAEAEKLEAQIKEDARIREKNRQNILDGTEAEAEWNRKYDVLFAPSEIDNFRKKLENLSAQCGQQANERAADHVLWVKSDRLVNAFDIFDPTDECSGFVFTREHLHCTHGMFGVQSNETLLTEWMKVDKVQRKDLYMRANFYNDKALFSEASETFAAIRKEAVAAGGVAFMSPEKTAKLIKSFVDLQKKVDSAWDEWLRDDVVLEMHTNKAGDTDSKFNTKQKELKATYADKNGKLSPQAEAAANAARRKYVSRMEKLSKLQTTVGTAQMARMADWTRVRWSQPTKVDHGLVAIAGSLLYPKLGQLTEKIGLADYFKTLSKEKLEALRKNMQASVERGLVSRSAADEYLAKNEPRIPAAAKAEAAKLAAAEKLKVKGSIAHVLKNEQDNLHNKITVALEELPTGERPSTNNFRQMRMGAAMFLLEGFAFSVKCSHYSDWTDRDKLEAAASLSSLISITCDFLYASVKSVREMKDFGSKVTPALNKSADIMRGGLKITAGLFSAVAGTISVWLDGAALLKERQQQNVDWVRSAIYASKFMVGAGNTTLGLIAAFSYTGPMLKYVAGERFVLTRVAERVALARTLWLIRVARFNLAGLVLTGIDLGYSWLIKDDELEAWCKASTFRKDKKTGGFFDTKPYASTQQELIALEDAFLLVTGQPAVERPEGPEQTPSPEERAAYAPFW